MIKLDNEFRYKGVDFKITKRGKKAIMLDAKSDFYTCPSVEVWQIRHSKDRTIKGNFISAGERKPSNEDYPYSAHQFMLNHFECGFDFTKACDKMFNEYENGIRPKNKDYETI
tara:strand:+ start:1904 stop:2242 length:339 start_codon:yes stop_codon:yes gene_type:complete